ncbi:hypothetical protein DSCA_31210 [Desulfosarcina alkanivorans]|uniref:Uncharacterized protein n=2 Tax=Desulfosarcina alkanivorans TaxID=571177 RepID=A0A5K7YQE8_9BACT|nr:hypothetical protein DSCA_31210 [Desulfosarcina alkanivorans]
MTGEQQQQLFEKIGAILKRAIDDRSPQKRPAGKAGLRAEKGYYRLLYLEGDVHEQADREALADGWEHLNGILRQLTDLPEIRAEILAGVMATVDEITGQLPGAD